MHTQAFINISQLVNFELFPCDLSPPLKPTVGGFSKDCKMSYTHPNSILLVAMGSRRQEEEMRKYPFLDFWVDRLWPFNFQPKIFKFKYLGLYSSYWKNGDSSRKLELGRRHGENPFLYFECFTPENPCDSSPPPRRNHEPGTPKKIFETWVFIF